MNIAYTLTPAQLTDFLLNVATVRPVFIWGAPGIGKSSFVQEFAMQVGLDCVSLLGSQLAPEDLIGVPQIAGGKSRFCGARIEALAYGCLTPHHATQFKAFVKQVRSRFDLAAILKGDMAWPDRPEDRDVLYFLSQSFRAQLVKELPAEKPDGSSGYREVAHRAKGLLTELAAINLEIAQMVVTDTGSEPGLPSWFLVEVVRDLPRLVERR